MTRWRPRRGLLERELNGEILVVDLETAKAYCLDGPAARVWRACKASQPFDEFVQQTGTDPADAMAALAGLTDMGLLETAPITVDRRGVLRRAATLSALTALGISAIDLPQPSAASSGGILIIEQTQCAKLVSLNTGGLDYRARIENGIPNMVYTVTIDYTASVLVNGMLTTTNQTSQLVITTNPSGNGSMNGTLGGPAANFDGGTFSAVAKPVSGPSLAWEGTGPNCTVL